MQKIAKGERREKQQNVYAKTYFCIHIVENHFREKVSKQLMIQITFPERNVLYNFLIRCIVLVLEEQQYVLLSRPNIIMEILSKSNPKAGTLPIQLFLDHFLT